MSEPQRHVWLLTNDVAEELADEYTKWYVEVHIPQVVAVPGFVSGERFETAPTQYTEAPTALRRFASIFEIEGDPAAAFAGLRAARAEGRLDTAPVPTIGTDMVNLVPLAPRHQEISGS
jgi:hypothetical protein